MAINFQPKKLLLVFQFSNTLLHIRNMKSKTLSQLPNKPITFHQSIFDDHYKVSYRRGRQQFLEYFFKEQQKNFDVGIWTNLNHPTTQVLIKKYFGRYFRQLLFVMATDRNLYGAAKQIQSNIRIKKDLNKIYSTFPGYKQGNTLIISSNQNLLQQHKRNDVIIPQYTPKSPLFQVDPGMHPFIKYIRGIKDTQITHNLEDIRTMVAAKNMASMFKRFSHNIYSERDYN